MPADDDLLRFVGEPPGYSGWWLVLGLLGIVAVAVWCVGIAVATMPSERLRGITVARGAHSWLTRRRAAAEVSRIGIEFRSGAITSAQAGAELSRVVRAFLAAVTGVRAQYLHVSEIADSDVSQAAPLLTGLAEAQFNPDAEVDMGALERAAGELIANAGGGSGS